VATFGPGGSQFERDSERQQKCVTSFSHTRNIPIKL